MRTRADEIFRTLIDTDVIEIEQEDGRDYYYTTVDLPQDFALDQPLSPFLIAALELLDPDSPSYALDVISMAEATLEDQSRSCALGAAGPGQGDGGDESRWRRLR